MADPRRARKKLKSKTDEPNIEDEKADSEPDVLRSQGDRWNSMLWKLVNYQDLRLYPLRL